MIMRVLSVAFLTTSAITVGADAAVVANISTGIDRATGLKLPNNATDPNYVIGPGGTAGFVGVHPIARSTPLPGPFITDASSTASRWITVLTNNGAEGMTGPAGTYNFQTTVDITGFDPSTARLLTVRFASDNKLINVYVNGTVVASPIPDGAHNGLEEFHTLPTPLGAGLFTPGVNTITFQVINDEGPQAFRYEGSVTATGGLPGDFNADAVVNATDIDLLCDRINAGVGPASPWDLNNDGSVNNDDVAFEVEEILDTEFGDTDTDGDVDLNDLGNLASGFGQPSERRWSRGNFDCDQDVDLNDLGTLATNFQGGREAALAAFESLVPEPSALRLLALLGALSARRRR
jgi:hypothetical protein